MTPLEFERPKAERWVAAALVVLMLAFYAWSVHSTTVPLVPRADGRWTDYHNLLVDGFLKGHLYLDYAPDPQLVAAKDPYNPSKRPLGGLHDAAYYQGHYYLYFGPAPAVLLLLPWRLLTGHELPAATAVLIMTSAGFLCSIGFWWRVRAEFFPRSRGWAVMGVVPVLGLAGMTHAVLRRPSFWELAIASGYGFAMAALLCTSRVARSRRPEFWMAAAGLLLGLAVASRPTYAMAGPFLLAPLYGLWLENRHREDGRSWPGRRWWQSAAAGGAALGAVVVGLLWYNSARFGHPFDFGFNYQLTDGYEANLRHFGWGYILPNLHLYYLSPPQWSRYFPFFHPIRHYVPAPPYYGSEEVSGLVPSAPFVLLAVMAPLGLRRRPVAERGRLTAQLLAPALLFLTVGAFALVFFSAVIRYMVDFTPALMVLAACGLLAVERSTADAGCAWAWRAAALGMAGVSAAFGAMSNLELYDLFRTKDPGLYRRIAKVVDAPVRWCERLVGDRRGPIEIQLRLPQNQAGRLEPLVTTGWANRQDYLFVYYSPEGGHIQLGFDHVGHGLEWTRSIAVDFQAPHRLQVDLGSFYPPEYLVTGAEPLRAGKPAGKHRLWVRLDGKVLFDHPQEFYDSSPEALRIGDSATGTYGEYFTGRILSVRRLQQP